MTFAGTGDPPLLVDACVLIAAIDESADEYPAAADLLENYTGRLIVPELVVTEVAYMLATRVGVDAEVAFIQDIADDEYHVVPVDSDDWSRIAELVDQWRGLKQGLGTVDASVVVTAERLGITALATLDGDFRAVPPNIPPYYWTFYP